MLLGGFSLPKSKFQLAKEEREAKARLASAEGAAAVSAAAAVFASTASSSLSAPAAAAATATAWVRGGVTQHGDASARIDAPPAGTIYLQQPAVRDADADDVLAAALVAPAAAVAQELPQPGARRRRELETLLEELKRKQLEPPQPLLAGGRSGRNDQCARGSFDERSARSLLDDRSARGSFDGPTSASLLAPTPEDSLTANLFVGNLAPSTTEEQLLSAFRRFGAVVSVKIMLPRTDEERARGRHKGFVLFAQRQFAEAALRGLQDAPLDGCALRVDWARSVRAGPSTSGALLVASALSASEAATPQSASAGAGLSLPPAAAAALARIRIAAAAAASGSVEDAPAAPSSRLRQLLERQSRSRQVAGQVRRFLSGWDVGAEEAALLRAAAHPAWLPREPAFPSSAFSLPSVVDVRVPRDRGVRAVADLWAQLLVRTEDAEALEAALRQRLAYGSAAAFAVLASNGAKGLEARHFAFLLDPDPHGDVQRYLRWRALSLQRGDSLRRWRTLPFQPVEGGAWWRPPPCPELGDSDDDVVRASAAESEGEGGGNETGALAEGGGRRQKRRGSRGGGGGGDGAGSDSGNSSGGAVVPLDGFAEVLGASRGRRRLQGTARDSLRRLLAAASLRAPVVLEGTLFALGHADCAADVAANIVVALCGCDVGTSNGTEGAEVPLAQQSAPAAPAFSAALSSAPLSAPVPRMVALLYLASDVLHNAGSARVRHAAQFREGFAPLLPAAFEALGRARRLCERGGRLSGQAVRERVLRVLASWARITLFPPAYLEGLESAFFAPADKAAAVPLATEIVPGCAAEDDLRAQCRLAGLACSGGAAAMRQRLAWLREFSRGRRGLGPEDEGEDKGDGIAPPPPLAESAQRKRRRRTQAAVGSWAAVDEETHQEEDEEGDRGGGASISALIAPIAAFVQVPRRRARWDDEDEE